MLNYCTKEAHPPFRGWEFHCYLITKDGKDNKYISRLDIEPSASSDAIPILQNRSAVVPKNADYGTSYLVPVQNPDVQNPDEKQQSPDSTNQGRGFWLSEDWLASHYQKSLTWLLYFSIARYIFGEEFFSSIGIVGSFSVFPAVWLYEKYIDSLGSTDFLEKALKLAYPSIALMFLLFLFSSERLRLYLPTTSFVALFLYCAYVVGSVYLYQFVVARFLDRVRRLFGGSTSNNTSDGYTLGPIEVQTDQQIPLLLLIVSLAALMYFTGYARSWRISDLFWVFGFASLLIVPIINIVFLFVGNALKRAFLCVVVIALLLNVINSRSRLFNLQDPMWSFIGEQLTLG